MSSWIDAKYITLLSSRLERYKNAGKDTHTFRCPYCGDSEKNKSKTRGYLYPIKDTIRFKCHNCGASRGIREFIKEQAPDLYRDYLFEFFGRADKPTEEQVPSAFKIRDMSQRFRHKENLLANFPTLASLPEDNPGRAYMAGRNIPYKHFSSLYWVEDCNALFARLEAYKDKKWKHKVSAVLTPFYGTEAEGLKLMFVQLRFLQLDHVPAKYMTLEVHGGDKVWGLDKIDLTKPVFVLEGAFDAMFVDNAVGCGGADLFDVGSTLQGMGARDVRLVWDGDFSTNPDVARRLTAAVNKGAQVVIVDKALRGKDINDAINNGLGKAFVMDYLQARTFSELDAKLELSKFRKPTNPKGITPHGNKKQKSAPSF